MYLFQTVSGAEIRRATFVALGSAALLLLAASNGQAQFVPTNHVREAVVSGRAPYLSQLPANQLLRLNIALPLRNEAELDDLLQDLYDPGSPSFHKFLSVREFTERFGPSEGDYGGAIRFAQQNGLMVTSSFSNRMVLNVTGSVENIERAFHVHMGVYQHPIEGRPFFSPDREPTPDLGVPLWHITGLDNFSIPRPASLEKADVKGDTTGSGPGGQFLGSDMRAAYYGGSALTGSGQSVGLFEFAGYNPADVTTYFNVVGQKLKVPVIAISADGSDPLCGYCEDGEQVLDIEEAISMAPGLESLRVYVSDSSDVAIFEAMASDGTAKSLSCSWAWNPADPASDDPIFKELLAQGQNLFVAAGDSGAYSSNTPYVYPADDIYVTAVGGTDLVTKGKGGPWQSETAWVHSGGGISPDNIGIPIYQKTAGVITAANKGSRTLRNSPDVAAEANTDNFICFDGICEGGWGGTSFAAPRWAGYLALANQQHVSKTGVVLGFINPTLYKIGLSSKYGTDFHDIVAGQNNSFSAVKGFDLVTGWGSPNGTGLIDALAP